MPVDLEPGRGRVEQSFPASLQGTIKAALAALDDRGVRPHEMSFRAGGDDPRDQAVLEVAPVTATNVQMVDNQIYGDRLFVSHQLGPSNGISAAFNPVLMSYKGKATDGRAVVVIVRSERWDARKDESTLVQVRIGQSGDDAWGRTFLDRVAAHGVPQAAKLVSE